MTMVRAPAAAGPSSAREGMDGPVIGCVEEFYAHALAIEREAGERYTEYSAWFDARGEDELARICRDLSQIEHAHFLELACASSELSLPEIPVSGYLWIDGSPEVRPHEDFMRAARPRDLLRIALHAECRAVDFFDWVVRTTPDEGVRLLARGMADEEREHVEWVMKAIEREAAKGAAKAEEGLEGG